MMKYTSLSRRPKHFQSFTGLKVEEFNKLSANLQNDYEKQTIIRLNSNNPHRRRKIGGGRKPIISEFKDRLLLALIWGKIYPSYLMLEYLFGVDESVVCRIIADTRLLLQDKFILPERRPGKKITTIEELKEVIPDLDEILADSTEQPIQRPSKKSVRNKHHSGKRKRFTLKTQLAVNKQGLILHLDKTVPGRKHDYKVFQESDLPDIIPENSKLYLDSGYQGIKKDFPHLNSIMPFKRTRNHQNLTHSEKIWNHKQRRARVAVEHTIAHLKKFNVLSQIYRNSLQNYQSTFRFVANVVNFRMLERLPSI